MCIKNTNFNIFVNPINGFLTHFNPVLTQYFQVLFFYLCFLMELPFYKYQGTGNDFIIIDNRTKFFPVKNQKAIAHLCDRHFGIGADGLILLENDSSTDFKMVYFNADGNESTMCGNGGRCIVAFAKYLKIIEEKTSFLAVDGIHHATIENDSVTLQMTNVDNIKINNNHVFVDTGSPHHVEWVSDLSHFPILEKGKEIRNNIYGTEGSNVNFVQYINQNILRVRTYERGVENETLACGTGVTAAAIAFHATQKTTETEIKLLVEGGELIVSFDVENGTYKNVFLTGPAQFVYKGSIEI